MTNLKGTLLTISKTREYLDYVERHILNVQKAWGVVQDKCKDMNIIYDDYLWSLINSDVIFHDMSKLSHAEFVPYRERFYPVHETENQNDDAFSKAWQHHLQENIHHWQSWTNIQVSDNPALQAYVAMNVIDWMAVGYEFGDTAQEYYEKNRDKINIPEWAEELMYEMFKRVYPQ